jgi:hypothetical protein
MALFLVKLITYLSVSDCQVYIAGVAVLRFVRLPLPIVLVVMCKLFFFVFFCTVLQIFKLVCTQTTQLYFPTTYSTLVVSLDIFVNDDMNGQQSTPLMLCAENTSYAMALGVDVYFRSHWIHLEQWKWCIT